MMNIPIKINSTNSWLEKLIIWILAARAVTFVWLAFASDQYIPVYADVVLLLRYCTIILAPLYLASFNGKVSNRYSSAFAALLLYWIMLVFNTYGGYQGSYIHELISIGCFLLMREESKIRVFEAFYFIILGSCAISILVYFAFIVGAPIGFETVPFFNDGIETSVYVKWFIFAIVGDGQYGLPRLCSIFNEPGGLGTVCGLLYAATYTYSGKIEKIILLLACFFSFSVAGFLLIIAFYAIHYIRKNIKYVIPVAGLLFFAIIAPRIDWGNEFFNDFVSRFEITDEGLAGDDRVSASFQKLWADFQNSNDVFFGRGATYGGDLGTASYKNLIIQFGYLGFGIYLLLWIPVVYRFAKQNKDSLAFFIIFLLSIYQRPVTITNAYGYTLVFGGLATMSYYQRMKKNENTLYL